MISLVKNIEKLEDFLDNFSPKPDIICISETRTNASNVELVSLPGYNFFCNHSNTKAGGAGVYVVESLKSCALHTLNLKIDGCEDVWTEVTISDKNKIVVGSVYRHPKSNLKLFFSKFQNNIISLKTYNKFVVLGDFNIDYNCHDTSIDVKLYVNGISSLGCEQLVTCPTRVSFSRKSILDHIYIDCSMFNEIFTTAVIECDISDHYPIFVGLNLPLKRKNTRRPLIRKILPEKIENFLNELDSTLKKNVPTNISDLTTCMTKVTNNLFPKTRQSRNQYKSAKKPWITKGILTSIKQQNRLYKKFKKSLDAKDFKRYKSFRNKLTHVKESSKAIYFQKLVKNSRDSSTTWKVVNKIIRKNSPKSNSLPTQISVKGNMISKPSEICRELNKYFCSIGHDMANSIVGGANQSLTDTFCGHRVQNSIFLNPTDEYEVISIINKFKPNKASGIDDIPTKLIKAAKHILSPYLTIIFNLGLEKGHYYDKLKIARVTPLFKGGIKSEVKNYRPISILTAFNKVFETIIKKRLVNFWNRFEVFSPTQFGFRENYSTTLAITHLREYILTELDNNMNICALFIDLAKAFDTVNHEILLYKLTQYGIRGFANDLIRSYLTNRKQLVCGDGFSSSYIDINIGVPQGSILGPLLFLIYINDISLCSNLKATLYADDSVFTLSHKNANTLQTKLNAELPKLNHWLKLNRLSLNLRKTKYLYFSKSNKNIAIQIDGSDILQTKCIKYLGVHLDDKLKWHKHVEYVEAKLSAATGAFSKLCKYLPSNTLTPVYYSLVYSHLQYAIICWGNTSKKVLNRLQIKQNRIIKILSKKFGKKVRLQPLFQKLNFLRLNKIFKFEIAKFMVKFHSNKLPQFCEEYLKSFVKVSSVHTHYTRSSFSNEYYVPRTFYHKTDQSLRVIGAKIWNDLPKCLRNKLITTSINHSSKLLKQHFLGTHFNQ